MEHLLCPKCNQEQPLDTILCARCFASVLLQGRYRLRKRLGGGSSSEFFQADDQAEGQDRVIKILSLEGQDKESIARLTAQLARLKSLSYPGIPKVFDYFEQPFQKRPSLFSVHASIEGERLTDRLKRGQTLTTLEVDALSERLIAIVEHLGACAPPITLRALKAQNIMLQRDGSPALINLDAMMQDKPARRSMQRSSAARLVEEALRVLRAPAQPPKAKHKPSYIPHKPQQQPQQRRARSTQGARPRVYSDKEDPLGLMRKSQRERRDQPDGYSSSEDPLGLIQRGEQLQQPKKQSRSARRHQAKAEKKTLRLRLVLIAIFLAVMGGYLVTRNPPREPRPGAKMPLQAPPIVEVPVRRPLPEASGSTIATVIHQDARIEAPETAEAVWASEVLDFSSQGAAPYLASEALGGPDISEENLPSAWSPRERSGGFEWVAVRFPSEVETAQILMVEFVSQRGLLRIDDLSGGDAKVLWERPAAMPPGVLATPSLTKITLQKPRRISALRMVFDTKEMTTWLQVDAIGLVPN